MCMNKANDLGLGRLPRVNGPSPNPHGAQTASQHAHDLFPDWVAGFHLYVQRIYGTIAVLVCFNMKAWSSSDCFYLPFMKT